MYKMTVHITKSFDTEAECQTEYDEIRSDVVYHKDLHMNCQITKKFTAYNPTYPNGHEVAS